MNTRESVSATELALAVSRGEFLAFGFELFSRDNFVGPGCEKAFMAGIMYMRTAIAAATNEQEVAKLFTAVGNELEAYDVGDEA